MLVPAIAQINAHPALSHTLTMHERRVGNRVSALQFSFERKQQESLDLPITWSDETIKILQGFGFTDSEISVMSQAHGQIEIVEALSRLPKAEQALKAKGLKLNSRKAYFEGILERVHAEFVPEKDAQEISDQVTKKVEEDEAVNRKVKIDAAFSEHQSTRFRESFFDLSSSLRDELVKLFEQSEEGQRLVTKSFIARGWNSENKPLLAMFRAWAKTARPELEGLLLPYPQDQSVEAWRDWKIISSP